MFRLTLIAILHRNFQKLKNIACKINNIKKNNNNPKKHIEVVYTVRKCIQGNKVFLVLSQNINTVQNACV